MDHKVTASSAHTTDTGVLCILEATYGPIGSAASNVLADVQRLVVADPQTGAPVLSLDSEGNLNELLGGDPSPGQRKHLSMRVRLRGRDHLITMTEWNGHPGQPLLLRHDSWLDCCLQGGLSNQLYGLAAALLIAHKTFRAVPLGSLRFIARRHELQPCVNVRGRAAAEAGGYLVPLRDLFDESAFLARVCTTDIVQLPEPLGPDHQSTVLNLAHDLPSDLVALTCHHPAQYVTVRDPFRTVLPSNQRDYALLVRVFDALVPNPRLMASVAQIRGHLLDRCRARSTLKSDSDTDINEAGYSVLHCRLEQDWRKAFPDKTLTPDVVASTVIDQWASSLLPSTRPLYLAGKVSADVLAQMRRRCPRVVYKTDAVADIEQRLGFEELAVIDREIALRATSFVGFAHSTFSLSIGVQRKFPACGLYGAKADHQWLPAFLYGPNGRPLFD